MGKMPWEYGKLHVMENGRYLACGETPFFWLGDTAWPLFQRCTVPEAGEYLRNRAEKGFNVIQAVLAHRTDGVESTTAELSEMGYWEKCDAIISLAEELGLYMALLPCWGSYVRDGIIKRDDALRYADFLVSRYQDRPNIIWMMGGDIRGSDGTEVLTAFGARMQELFPDRLIGYHPFGRTSSSDWFHNEPWLDFNMFQSGHRRYDQVKMASWDDPAKNKYWFGEDNWRYVRRDLSLEPPKPTVDGEPSYERIRQGLHDPTQPLWQASDVRRYAYWSVLEGAMGHTYGHNAIIQFYRPEQGPGFYGVTGHWRDAMDHPGAFQMGYLKGLMTGVDFTAGRPNEARLAWGQKERYDRVSVFEGPAYILCYTFSGKAFALDLRDKKASARWFDPATGAFGESFNVDASAEVVFTPPEKTAGGTDWVLLLRF